MPTPVGGLRLPSSSSSTGFLLRILLSWTVLAGALLAPASALPVGTLAAPGLPGPAAAGCEAPVDGAGAVRARVPFELYDNHLYVPATVEGTAPRSFLLDSGATVTVVDWGVVAALDLPVRDPGSSRGAGAGTIRSARLHDAEAFAYRGRGLVLPMEVRSGWAHVEGMLGLRDGRAVNADLIVDTGSKLSLVLTTDFVRRHRLLSSFPERATGTVGAGVGGEARFELARLPRLVLDTLTHRQAVVGLSSGSGLDVRGFDGVLGTEFLRRFRVFFDYAGGRMILEPGADRDDPERFDMSGLVLVAPRDADGGRPIRVHRVARGTPAAWAGLRPGDRILSIDGFSPPELDLHEARRLLRGEPGTVRTLRVEREGRVLTYVFALEPLI